MTRGERGYWEADAAGIGAGTRYFYRLDGEKDRPDPASRYQPQGVHGPSEVVDLGFGWTADAWCGIPLQKYIIYELHVGTFTAEGTFDAAIERLPYLAELGVTAVEIMPIAQFPGERNWGYDGVNLFAPQNSYGGPPGLQRLVDAAHRAGLAVVLDVVYNHLGPDGNYLSDFGPYFAERYRSPWGAAVNFDGPGSDEVRRYFVENALSWLREYRIDALRLDAVHAMLDFSAGTFLQELAEAVAREGVELGRQVFLIAESDLNDSRLVQTPEEHGYGLDAQWADDLHHSLHVLLTGERSGYYEDFAGPEERVRAARLPGQGAEDGHGLHGSVRAVTRAAARQLVRQDPRLPAGGWRAEPRPGGQPHAGRPPVDPCLARPAQAGRGRGAAVAVPAAALHGRGVGRDEPVPVLRQTTPMLRWSKRCRQGAGTSSPASWSRAWASRRTRRTSRRSNGRSWTGRVGTKAGMPSFGSCTGN